MAGFKQTILSHSPKLFLTFDGDAFDPITRKLLASPQVFLDESGFGSNIMLHNEDESYPAYRMGMPSLVDLEQTDQRSTSFGWYGHQPSATTRWPKAFVEVQHQSHLALTENNGSYTVGFYTIKQSNEQNWRDVEQSLGNSYTQTLNKRFIRKAGSFDFYFRDYWSQTDELRFTHPAGELVLQLPSWFLNRKNFVVLTWSVTETDPDVYLQEAKMYINGHVYASFTTTSSGSFPGSTSTSPIEIAGVINAASNFEDRQTSNMQLDQIFLLNKALTADEVCRLYRKSRTYDNISINALATAYWPMTDVEDPSSTVMADSMSYNNGTYIGGTTRINRQQTPPSAILGGSSVFFHNGGMAAAHRYQSSAYYIPVLSLSSDWTVDMWVQFQNTERSVIWACQEDDFPFSGLVIEANRRNNVNVSGHIQMSVSQEYQASTMQFKDNGDAYNFNDGRFHHICVVRKGSEVALWVDGIKHSSVTCPVQSVTLPGPGQVYFMGAAPGNMNTVGYMSAVGVYPYALDDAEVRMKNSYSQIYRIQGVVTLQGNPHQATIRAYTHRNGQLAVETLASNVTGEYTITLYDNSLIDLMALNKQDPNIRYRVYGPITPAVFEDLPL